MTHLTTSERTWNSETLNRRIKLSELPALSDADLAMFRLELQDASASIRAQIERLGDAANPEWKKRAIGKQHVTHLFVTGCGHEHYNRDRAAQLERARLKTQRVIEANKRNESRSAQYIRALQGLIIEELGEVRAQALCQRANQIVSAADAQAA